MAPLTVRTSTAEEEFQSENWASWNSGRVAQPTPTNCNL